LRPESLTFPSAIFEGIMMGSISANGIWCVTSSYSSTPNE